MLPLQLYNTVALGFFFPFAITDRELMELTERHRDLILRVIGNDHSNFAEHTEREQASSLVLGSVSAGPNL